MQGDISFWIGMIVVVLLVMVVLYYRTNSIETLVTDPKKPKELAKVQAQATKATKAAQDTQKALAEVQTYQVNLAQDAARVADLLNQAAQGANVLQTLINQNMESPHVKAATDVTQKLLSQSKGLSSQMKSLQKNMANMANNAAKKLNDPIAKATALSIQMAPPPPPSQ